MAKSAGFSGNRFLFLASCLLFVLRLPVLVYNRELNVDESQMLTQAMTLAVDPVYWRSVDGTTGGPLSSYFLTIVGMLTGRYDYMTAHLGAFLLVLITLFFLFKALKSWFDPYRAALGLLPVILFYGFTRTPDFVHYSSEHFPIALLAACVWLVSGDFVSDRSAKAKMFALGVLLTLVPFGKIQAVPLAAGIGLYALIRLATHRYRGALAALFGGVVAACASALLLFFAGGVLNDFFTFYIKGNFQYKNNTTLFDNLRFQFSEAHRATDLLILLIPLVIWPVLTVPGNRKVPRNRSVWWLGIGLLAMSFVAILRTGSGYTHYLLFLVLPFSLLLTSLTGPDISPAKTRMRLIFPPLLGVALAVGVFWRQHGVLNSFVSGPGLNRGLPFTATGMEAARFLNKGEYMVVWGWNCQYYVECQAPQGVAENHSIRSAFKHPMQEIYRERYLRDLERTRPAVFIDAVGPNSLWLQDTLTQSYRSFPELADYVDKNYTLIGRPGSDLLFVRNDLRP